MASFVSSSEIHVNDDDDEKAYLANSPAIIDVKSERIKPEILLREYSGTDVKSERIKPEILLREYSGIDVDPETKENYMMVRCISMDEEGNLESDIFLKEIFEGFITFSTGYVVEIFGHPSTIILENNASITIASQIYERDYSINKDSYKDVSTIEEYFATRKQLIESEKQRSIITWLGAPSVVFTYKYRNILKQYVNNNPVINLFFWITSFNSSRCIRNYSVNAKKNKIKYCDKYAEIKRFCKDRNEYQIHKTYYDIMHPNEDMLEKYITSFEKIIEILLKEEKAVKEYNEVYVKKDFQRYNELFTYFFPWDIDGIERGLISNEKFEDLLKK
jgi:hypothetical protein